MTHLQDLAIFAAFYFIARWWTTRCPDYPTQVRANDARRRIEALSPTIGGNL